MLFVILNLLNFIPLVNQMLLKDFETVRVFLDSDYEQVYHEIVYRLNSERSLKQLWTLNAGASFIKRSY